MTAEKGKPRNRDRFTGLIGPLRDRLEAVIAEYREWASIYLIRDEPEELGEVFERLIQNGRIEEARDSIVFLHREYWEKDSPGITAMAKAHARNIANAWNKLHRAEKRAITNPRLIRVG